MKYEAPRSVDEAYELLGAPGSRVFAGATDLIPQLRAGRPEPEMLVDLKRISRLTAIGHVNGIWTVGAATPVVRITEDDEFRGDFPGLVEATELIGSDQIQSRASWGGNVCNASPAADSVPALVVNGARAVIASGIGTRTVSVSDLVTGPGATSLTQGEFVVEFVLDPPPPGTADAYLRFIPRSEMDIAVVGAAARVTLDDAGNCAGALIALGAVAPTVVRVPAAEEALVGGRINDAALAVVAAEAREACDPIDDKRGTIGFRRQVAGVLAKRVVVLAADRARARKSNGAV